MAPGAALEAACVLWPVWLHGMHCNLHYLLERIPFLPLAPAYHTLGQHMPQSSRCSFCQAGCHTAHKIAKPRGLSTRAAAVSPVQRIAGARLGTRSPSAAGRRARVRLRRRLPSRLRVPGQLGGLVGGLPAKLHLSALLPVILVLTAPPPQGRLHLRRGHHRAQA